MEEATHISLSNVERALVRAERGGGAERLGQTLFEFRPRDVRLQNAVGRLTKTHCWGSVWKTSSEVMLFINAKYNKKR